MPNVGLSELLIVVVIALLVFGPNRLPEMARSLGRALRSLRQTAADASRELGIDDLRRDVEDLKDVAGKRMDMRTALGLEDLPDKPFDEPAEPYVPLDGVADAPAPAAAAPTAAAEPADSGAAKKPARRKAAPRRRAVMTEPSEAVPSAAPDAADSAHGDKPARPKAAPRRRAGDKAADESAVRPRARRASTKSDASARTDAEEKPST